MQNILNQFPAAQMEEPTQQQPRGAELLFCFDVVPPPTTLAQHETNSGSTSCFYWAANIKPRTGGKLQRQLQRHLVTLS